MLGGAASLMPPALGNRGDDVQAKGGFSTGFQF
jgi:hypothetical protein